VPAIEHAHEVEPPQLAPHVRHELAHELFRPVQREAVFRIRVRAERLLDGTRELGRDDLVGVYLHDPVVRRELDGLAMLTQPSEPRLVLDARARALRDLDGAIRAARIEYENFVGP
jgi:hypothetical protein